MQGAIVTLTKGMALELATKGIRVNCIAPGPVWTPLVVTSFPTEKVSCWAKSSVLVKSGTLLANHNKESSYELSYPQCIFFWEELRRSQFKIKLLFAFLASGVHAHPITSFRQTPFTNPKQDCTTWF